MSSSQPSNSSGIIQTPGNAQERPNKRRRTLSSSIAPGSGSLTPAARRSVPQGDTHNHSTLFDAVAGRLSARAFHKTPSNYLHARKKDDISVGLAPITPAKALSKTPDAPRLDKEDSTYNMHKRLSERTVASTDVSEGTIRDSADLKLGRLPSSDLLKALHAYSSDFYAAATQDRGRCDWASLDETALLAIGILMEEEMRRLLGKNGWRLFLEHEEYEHVGGTLDRRQETKHFTEASDQGHGQDESEVMNSLDEIETNEEYEEI